MRTDRFQISSLVRGYIPQFDGLRALSILAVFVAHSECLKALPHAQILEYGRVGVDLFFVLSGFLITGILLDSKSSRHYFRNFYIRRALRIWPLYYLVLSFVFLLTSYLLKGAARAENHGWPFFVLYIQNLVPHINIPYGLEPTWSLAVEEQYYMTWPFLVFLLRKRTLSLLLPCVVIFSLVCRITGYEHGSSLKFIHTFTLCRMDALSVGSLAAIWLRSSECAINRWRLRAVICLASGIVGVIIARAFVGDQSTIISYTFIALSFVGILGISLLSDPERSILGRILTTRWMRYTGKISYGLYLFHMPVFLASGEFIRRQQILSQSPYLKNALTAVIQFFLVFLLASLSWTVFESPLLRLKALFPSGSKTHEELETDLCKAND